MAGWAEDVCLQSDCWLIDWVGGEGLSGERKQVQLEEKWEGKKDRKHGDRAQEEAGKV